MKKSLFILTFVLLSACSSPKKAHTVYTSTRIIPNDSQIFVEHSSLSPLIFRGELIIADKSEASSMMYPGYGGLGGFLVGIATHAAMESGMASSQQNAAIEKANEVLAPLEEQISQLDTLSVISPMSDSLSLVVLPEEQSTKDKDYLLSSSPMFKVAQDYSSIRLQNVISISSEDSTLYQNLIEVARSLNKKEREALVSNVEILPQLAEELMGESLRVGISDSKGLLKSAPSMQTFKYELGGKTQYQRANLVSEDCDNLVIKTLRNWIKVIPTSLTNRKPMNSCVPEVNTAYENLSHVNENQPTFPSKQHFNAEEKTASLFTEEI